MNKNDAAAKISFHGLDVAQILLDNPIAHRFVESETMKVPYAIAKCHVESRADGVGPLLWTVSIASPEGRRTFSIEQKTPNAPVRASTA